MARGYTTAGAAGEHPSPVVYFAVKVYSVAANTFVECVRQPIFAIIIAIAAALIVLSPYMTLFTLQTSQKLITDMGLATVMLAGLLLAAFSASSVVWQEIENRTVLTVISKPVGRDEFIFGKFLGVAGGLVVGTYLLSVALVLTIRGGSMEGGSEEALSIPVTLSIFGSLFLAVLYGVYSNFFHDRAFASRAIAAAIPLFTVCFVVAHGWFPRAITPGVDAEEVVRIPQVIYACVMILWSILLLSTVALAASTRLTVVMTLLICAGVFVLGLLSDFFFRDAAKASLTSDAQLVGWLKAAAALLIVIGIGVVIFKLIRSTAGLVLCISLFALGLAWLPLLRFLVNPIVALTPWVWLVRLLLYLVAGLMTGGGFVAGGGVFVLSGLLALVAWAFGSAKWRRTFLTVALYSGILLMGLSLTALFTQTGMFGTSRSNAVVGKILYDIVPNLQVFWITDIVTARNIDVGGVPLSHVFMTGLYSLCHVCAFLFLAMLLFRRRQVA